MFFVDLPDDDKRRSISETYLTLRKQSSAAFGLADLVAAGGVSGAEIAQAVILGLYRALHRKVRLDTTLLLEEIREMVLLPVSRREDVDALWALAADRFVPVR